MKILLIYPKFHDYGEVLKQILIRDHFVTTYEIEESKVYKNYFLKILSHIYLFFNFPIIDALINRYLHKQIPFAITNTTYDRVLIIKGFALNTNQIDNIKSNWKILYLWDKINRFPKITSIFNKFNSVYTYDYQDSQEYNLLYLPLFITKKIIPLTIFKDTYFMVFIGEYTEYRYNILEELSYKLLATNKKFYLKLFDPKEKISTDLIIPHPILHDDFFDILSKSRYIIDLSRNGTLTLTERTTFALTHDKIVLYDNDIIEYLKSNFLPVKKKSQIPFYKETNFINPQDWLNKILEK